MEELPGELILVDGKNGMINKSLNMGKASLRGAAYVDGVIATLFAEMFKVYNSNLSEIYTQSFNTTPTSLTTFEDSQVLFVSDKNVTVYSLEDRNTLWTWTAPKKVTDVLITPSRIVCAYPSYLAMLDFDGHFICRTYWPRRAFSSATYQESLHRLDDTHFLYFEDVWVPFGTSPNVALSMWNANESALEFMWRIEIGGRAANKPHAISDINSDGVNDFVCRILDDTNIGVFSGKTGKMIYSTDISAYYIYALCPISDIDGDGLAEVALNQYAPNAFHTLYISSFKGNSSASYAIKHLDLYSHLVSIQDVNGDGFLDIVGATLGGKVECYAGYDSRVIPEFPIFLITPTFMAAILVTAMLCKKRSRSKA